MSKLARLNLMFDLPEWCEQDFSGFRKSAAGLKVIGQSAGMSSDKFREICQHFYTLASTGGQATLLKMVRTNSDARAIVHLWLHNTKFLSAFPVTEARLDQLKGERDKVSQMALIGLLELYFREFDHLGEASSHLGQYLINELSRREAKSDGLRHIIDAREKLFTLNGPLWLVQAAKTQSSELSSFVELMGLSEYSGGRFIKVANSHYYLSQLKDLSPEETSNPLIEELAKKDVYEALFENGLLIGHEVIKILVDKVEGTNVPEHWQRLVLAIAGDPRTASSSPKYQRWWVLLDENIRRAVRGWLSRLDLKLFLEALDQSAKTSEDTRKFMDRKILMEGLLNQNLVMDSRLFLSRHADEYMREVYSNNELPEYALSMGSSMSMIYLCLGDIHIIEGSKDAALILMKGLPTKSGLMDFSKKYFTSGDFRTKLQSNYYSEFGRVGFLRKTHQGFWQRDALDYFEEHGLKLDKSQVLSASNYKEYKRRFGV